MDWQEGVLAHVRKAHFSMVAICVSLCIAASLVPNRTANSALDQSEAVLRFASAPFVEQIQQGSPVYELLISSDEFDVLVPEPGLVIELQTFTWVNPASGRSAQIGSFTWDSAIEIREAYNKRNLVNISSDLYGLPSLKQFTSDWDFLQKATPARIFQYNFAAAQWYKDGNEFDAPPSRNDGSNGTGPPFGSDLLTAKLGLYQETDPERRFAPNQWYVLVLLDDPLNDAHPGFDEVRIPVDLTFAEFNSLITLFPDGIPAGAPNTSAESAFSDLFSLAKGLETLELDQLRDWLKIVAENQSDSISAFGVDIPLSLVGRWGAALVLAAQLYFLLHIRHAVGREIEQDRKDNFPWIGTYSDSFSKRVFQATATILPVATCFFVSRPWEFSNNANWIELALVFGLCALSVAFAYLAFKNAAILQREPQS